MILTDDVKKMYLGIALLITRSELGRMVADGDDTATFEDLKRDLPKVPGTVPYPDGFLDAIQKDVSLFLGAGNQPKRDALKNMQKTFQLMGGNHGLAWGTEPCPKGEERFELQTLHA